jgi:REP element-mobilizing transposase RayT
LMSNHVHLIAVPGRPDSLSVLMRRVHGRYAQYLNLRVLEIRREKWRRALTPRSRHHVPAALAAPVNDNEDPPGPQALGRLATSSR